MAESSAKTIIDTGDLAQIEAGRRVVVEYLEEARALERSLVTNLKAHIAITPPGNYRSRLQRHLDKTRAHAGNIGQRLDALSGRARPRAPRAKAAKSAASTARRQAKRAGSSSSSSSGGNGAKPPIANYDELTVDEVNRRIDRLTTADIRKVATYERDHKKRTGVLEHAGSKLKEKASSQPLRQCPAAVAAPAVAAPGGAARGSGPSGGGQSGGGPAGGGPVGGGAAVRPTARGAGAPPPGGPRASSP